MEISFDAIPLPAAGRDQVAPELLANAEHVHVHQIRQGTFMLLEVAISGWSGKADERWDISKRDQGAK